MFFLEETGLSLAPAQKNDALSGLIWLL